jgi:hypothetical protein
LIFYFQLYGYNQKAFRLLNRKKGFFDIAYSANKLQRINSYQSQLKKYLADIARRNHFFVAWSGFMKKSAAFE